MKIKVERKSFLAGIQRVAGVVEARNSMPILSHLLIQATGASEDTVNKARVSFFATDLEIGICCDTEAEVERSGKVTASAKKLLEIVQTLPDGIVEIEQIDRNWISIRAGNAHFKIAGLPPEEFPSPAFPEGEAKIAIDPKLLSLLMKKVLFAVGENDPRYILNGILLRVQKMSGKSVVSLVATDGHRLAMAEGMIKTPQEWPVEESVILPKKATLEIKRLLEEQKSKEKSESADAKAEKGLEITVGKGVLAVQYGTTLLTSRLMHGNYPNYQQVIPKDNDKKVSTNRNALCQALGRVSILSHEKTHAIKVDIGGGEIVLQSNNPEIGEAQEQLAVSFTGEPFTTVFSARYLLDLLTVLDSEEVVFEFKDPDAACLVREDFHWGAAREVGKFLSIIMPIKD